MANKTYLGKLTRTPVMQRAIEVAAAWGRSSAAREELRVIVLGRDQWNKDVVVRDRAWVCKDEAEANRMTSWLIVNNLPHTRTSLNGLDILSPPPAREEA